MAGKITKLAASTPMTVKDRTIERINNGEFYRMGIVAMGKMLAEEFIVIKSGASGKIHIEALVQNLNSKTGQMYQMAALVPDDQQWELLVDFVQRSGLVTEKRQHIVWRDARAAGIKIDLRGIKDVSFGEQPTKKDK